MLIYLNIRSDNRLKQIIHPDGSLKVSKIYPGERSENISYSISTCFSSIINFRQPSGLVPKRFCKRFTWKVPSEKVPYRLSKVTQNDLQRKFPKGFILKKKNFKECPSNNLLRSPRMFPERSLNVPWCYMFVCNYLYHLLWLIDYFMIL